MEWTVKDGFVYSGSTLMAEVRDIVARARAERAAVATEAAAASK